MNEHLANYELEESTDRELHNVGEFKQALQSISTVEQQEIHVDLDDAYVEESPVEQAKRLFRSYCKPGVLYLESQFLSVATGKIDFEPDITRGGKRSYHGVFFGSLIDEHEQEIPVAVKPHKGDEYAETCLNEYFNNDTVSKLNYPNLTLVGFMIGTDGVAYSMTATDDSLSTLDSIDWSDFIRNQGENPGMQEIWRQVAEQAAILHASGNRSHGDLAARNIATTIDGGVFFIDWEKASFVMSPPRDAEARYARSHGDLSVLLESMCLSPEANFKAGIGLFRGDTSDWWEDFNDIFFSRYRDMRLELVRAGSHHTSDLKDVSDELEVLEASLRDDLGMYYSMSLATAQRA